MNIYVEFSYLYLTYFYFDKKRYNDFLHYYELIDFEYFKISELEQYWRELQHRQLKIASKIYLELYDDVNDEITELLKYRSLLVDESDKVFLDSLFFAIVDKIEDLSLRLHISERNMNLLEEIALQEDIMVEHFETIKHHWTKRE